MTDKPAVDYRAEILARIEGDERPESFAYVCTRPKLWLARRQAQEALADAEAKHPNSGDGISRAKLAGPVAAARKELDAIEAEIDLYSVRVIFRAMREGDFRAYMAAWRGRSEEEKNDDTGLLERCFNRVETRSGEAVDLGLEEFLRLYERTSRDEADSIATAALRCNLGAVDFDFFAKR